jgi:hypothetical protein
MGRHSTSRRLALVALAAIVALAVLTASAQESANATYEVTVTPLWTPDRFPVEYPKRGAHFSGVIGATHDGSLTLFRVGNLPSPGLERLSELGELDALAAEIELAHSHGVVGSMFESRPNQNLGRATQKFTVTVDVRYPIVTMVLRIAPSPDWFAGVAGVNLMKEIRWFVAEKTVDALAYDAGGDDGATYTAADADTDPKQPTRAASPKHFAKNGNAMPVARITFRRK